MKPAQPSNADILNRLVAVTSERDQLLMTLRDLGNQEGDATLVHQVCIWRATAERNGQRQALAERVVRALKKHWPEARVEVRAWQDGTNQQRSA